MPRPQKLNDETNEKKLKQTYRIRTINSIVCYLFVSYLQVFNVVQPQSALDDVWSIHTVTLYSCLYELLIFASAIIYWLEQL